MSTIKEGITEELNQLLTPIDFEHLVEEGILARKGRRFQILDRERVPEKVWAQAESVECHGDGAIILGFLRQKSVEHLPEKVERGRPQKRCMVQGGLLR